MTGFVVKSHICVMYILCSAIKLLIPSKIQVFVYILYVYVLCIFIMYIYKYTHIDYIFWKYLHVYTFIYL